MRIASKVYPVDSFSPLNLVTCKIWLFKQYVHAYMVPQNVGSWGQAFKVPLGYQLWFIENM